MKQLSRVIALLAAIVLVASPAHATFHFMSISEIMVGVGGDPDAQYVELRVELAGQSAVTNTRLAAFNADGTVTNVVTLSNHNVASGAMNRRILYATAAFTTQTGLTPDFTIPAGMIFAPSGMVCWGAPSQLFVPAPTWDATNPNNYIDCVAYGNYTGPTRSGPPTVGSSGTPSALPPGDGTFALTRTARKGQDAGNNALDFALRAPGPCLNAATGCDAKGCPSGGGQCAIVGCSNGNLDAGEVCDDGNLADNDGCEADCSLTPTPQQLACRRGIIKAGSKFGQAYTKALSACQLQVLASKIPGPCPDTKTADQVTKAEASKVAAITKSCSGVSVAGAGFPASCPGLDATCGGALATLADVTTCVDCAQEQAGSSFEGALFTSFAGGQPSAAKCQAALAKIYNKLYATNTKALAKCEDGDLTGKIPGPCPDAAATGTFSTGQIKAAQSACKACGGPDKVCGGGDDVPVADIGITSCPAVTHAGVACASLPVTTVAEVADCLRCVAGSRSDCADFATAQSRAVPAGCNPVP